MRVKKIIPLFVVFAMVTSLLSVPAHATYGGGVGRADLWEWTYGLYQSGNTDFNPGGIYGDGVGREELAAAYSTYVSTLDRTTATSPVVIPDGYALYNGVELPDINTVWTDKATYPYAYILHRTETDQYIFAAGAVEGYSNNSYFLNLGKPHICAILSDGEWGESTIYNPSYDGVACYSDSWGSLVWCNHNLCNENGSVYLAASAPIVSGGSGNGEDTIPDSTTRPTSISGNYGIIGDDGQLTSIGTQTIVNEGNSTYYNPVTSTTYDLSGWTYDYSTRTYDLSTTSGDTITVEYADESVNIMEGDTVYNVYYLIEQEPVDPDTCEHDYTCVNTTLPSCTGSGLDTYTCSLCGNSYTQTVAAVGHSWTVKQSVNTQYDENGSLVTEGYTIYECSTCGEQYKSTDGTSPPNSSGSSSDDSTIGGLIETLISGVGSIVGGIVKGVLALLTKAVEALGGIGDLLSALWDSLGSIFDGFTGFLVVVFPFLPEEFLAILQFGFILLVAVGIIKKFSS